MTETPKYTLDERINILKSKDAGHRETYAHLHQIVNPESRIGPDDINSTTIEERRYAFLDAATDGTLVSFGGTDNLAIVDRTDKGKVTLKPAGTLDEAMKKPEPSLLDKRTPKVSEATLERINLDLADGTASMIETDGVLGRAMEAGQPLKLTGHFPEGSAFKQSQITDVNLYPFGPRRTPGNEQLVKELNFKGKQGK